MEEKSSGTLKWMGPNGEEKPINLAIAYVTDDFLPAKTGVGVHVQKISQEMMQRGHHVVVVTSRRKGQPKKEEWNGVLVYRVFSIPLEGYYQAFPSSAVIRQIFMENSIDLVHFHYLSLMTLQILGMAKSMRTKTLYTGHMTADLLTSPIFMKPFKGILTRALVNLYGKFDRIICVSRGQAKRVEQFNISSRVHYVSNPVDFEAQPLMAQSTGGCFTVLFVGRLSSEKNIGYLLEGFGRFSKQCPQSKLLIAGHGVMEPELRRQVEQLDLKEKVFFLGQVAHSELPKYYSSCDVFVLPSLKEVFPLVALEAMRFSRPVIVTNRILCADEVVDHEKNGYIVDAANPGDLAKKLSLLQIDPLLRRRMGAVGLEKSIFYTTAGVCDNLEKIYMEVRVEQISPLGPRPIFTDTAVIMDRRRQCVACQRGTFEERSEQILIASDSKDFLEEYFAVWRCPICLSLHSLIKVPLDEYYRAAPYKKRTINNFNRAAFENAFNEILRRGVAFGDKVLFCGITSGLFKDYFQSKGWTAVEAFEEVPTVERLNSSGESQYDTLIWMDFLEWIDDPQVAFGFARKHLRAGGKLFVHTPDAQVLDLKSDADERLNQPFRLHVFSRVSLESLARAAGFRQIGLEHRNWLDTWAPFINWRALHELTRFRDGSLESGFTFEPRHIWRKWWRIPWFLVLAFLGRIIPDRVNMLGTFEKE